MVPLSELFKTPFLKGICFSVLLSVAFSGCVVYRQSGRLNADQAVQIKKSPYSNLTLEVKRSSDGYRKYGDFVFAEKIRQTQLFKDVKFEENSKGTPDLVFELQNRGHRPYMCATGDACLMIGTLGLVPVYSDGNYDFIFTISSPGTSKTIDREFIHTYINKSIVGWLASLWGIFPGWTFSQKTALRESQDQLACFLISLQPDINSLLLIPETAS